MSSSRRARRASSPHVTSPFSPAPTSPVNDVYPPSRKSPRPQSVQPEYDMTSRPRRSSLKATVPVPSTKTVLDRLREREKQASPTPADIPQTPPLPSFLYTSPSIRSGMATAKPHSTPPLASPRTPSYRAAEVTNQRSPNASRRPSSPRLSSSKPPPSPKPFSASRPRSRSRSARPRPDAADSGSDYERPPALSPRMPSESHFVSQQQPDYTQSRSPNRPTITPRAESRPAGQKIQASPLTYSSRTRDLPSSPATASLASRSPRVPSPAFEPTNYIEEKSSPAPSRQRSQVPDSPYRERRRGPFRVVNGAESPESTDDNGASRATTVRSPIPTPNRHYDPPPTPRSTQPESKSQSRYRQAVEPAVRSPSPTPPARKAAPPVESVSEYRVDDRDVKERRGIATDRYRSEPSSGRGSKPKVLKDVMDSHVERSPNPKADYVGRHPSTPTLGTPVQSSGKSTPNARQETRSPLSQATPRGKPSMRDFHFPPRAVEEPQQASSQRREVQQGEQSRNNALLGLVDGLGLGIALDGPPAPEPVRKAPSRRAYVPDPPSSMSSSDASFYQSHSEPTVPPPTPSSSTTSQSEEDYHAQYDPDPMYDHVVPEDEGLTAATSLNRISAFGYDDNNSASTFDEPSNIASGNDALFLALLQPHADTTYNHPDDRDEWHATQPIERPPSADWRKTAKASGSSARSDSPMLPIPRPSIVVQPSTSISSAEDMRPARSSDSLSQYSEGERPRPDTMVLTDDEQRWSRQSFGEASGDEEWSDGAQRLITAVGGEKGQADMSNTQNHNAPPPERPVEPSRPQPLTYNPDFEHPSHDGRPPVPALSKTWKSTLPGDALRSLLEKYGTYEMRRQEVIWELCNTEQAFVESLRTVLRLFVQPLRTKQRKWIPGIPKDVTKLFDWLDDIVQLHSHIASSLLDVRSAQYPVVLQVAEAFRVFVPCLELHQPYLVRLESVSQSIEDMIRDSSSDFGEFIRIQTASPECGSLSLTSFLLKPVQRLMKYPLFFKQLWELTPRNHPDYLATFSLLHSTDMIIRAMQEVKAREDEYDVVKSLAERIKGLPPGFTLARRDRRLVAQGMLRRMSPSEKEQGMLESSPAPEPYQAQKSPMIPPPRSTPLTPNLSKLMPITSPHYAFHSSPVPGADPSRPDSTGSDLSSAPTYPDMLSDTTRSTTSSIGPLSPSTTTGSLRPDSVASSSASFEHDFFADASSLLRRRSSSRSMRSKREIQVYAFVFTDFVLLTLPISERNILKSPKHGEAKECWKVLDAVGISRVLGVTNLSGRLNVDHLLAVDLLPMNPGLELDTADSPCAVPVYLSLPERMTSRMALAPPHILEDARAKWLEAFERCSQHTLKSLCLPLAGRSRDIAPLDFTIHSQNSISVMSILSSGAPFPKSPSQQALKSEADDTEDERNERGWWSAQLHKVLGEMERGEGRLTLGDLNVGMTVQPRRQRMPEPKRASTTGGPRPLLLGSRNAVPGGEERKSLLRSFSRKGR